MVHGNAFSFRVEGGHNAMEVSLFLRKATGEIGHAEDAASHAFRMERLKLIKFLTHTDEFKAMRHLSHW